MRLRLGLSLFLAAFSWNAWACDCYTQCSGASDYDNCHWRCVNDCPLSSQGDSALRAYGAVALSPYTLDYGYSYGQDSRRDAEAEAMRQCASNDSKPEDCESMLWFYDSCAAIAIKHGPTPHEGGAWGYDYADTVAAAKRKALAECNKQTEGGGCEIEATFCSPN